MEQKIGKTGTESKRFLPGDGFSGRSMLVCIQGWRRGEPFGVIAHPECKGTEPFKSLAGLCLGIGRMACSLEALQKRARCRFPEERPRLRLHGRKIQEVMVLELFARQHGSLQGRIRGRVTGGRHVYFCSALELQAFLRDCGGSSKSNAQGLARPSFMAGHTGGR